MGWSVIVRSRRLAEKGNHVTLIELPTKSGSKISPATREKLIETFKKLECQDYYRPQSM